MLSAYTLLRGRTVGIAALTAMVGAWQPAGAQTDYYNTDAGRPIQTEDAYPVEYRAVEIQAAPLRLERSRGGVYHWSIEPEVALGILPRTQVEIGFPLASIDGGVANRTTGLAGVEISALHNLNAETSIPAFGIAAGVLLPVGGLAPDVAYGSAKLILTRTFSWLRLHVNGEVTIGPRPSSANGNTGTTELSRWTTGIALDRTFPLRSMLLTAELVAREPLAGERKVEWDAGAGVRYQLTPRWALDGGIGRRLTGDEHAWQMTFGSAYALGLPWRR